MRHCLASLTTLTATLLCLQNRGSDTLIVHSILIEGNKHTRDEVILRELPFQAGDTLSAFDLDSILRRGQELVMNTAMFKSATVTASRPSPGWVDVTIRVEERWYIYPIPVFELADRNFNVWWYDFDHDLRRTVYGLNFYHNNLTGRADPLKLEMQFGFNQLWGIRYRLPFLSATSKFGLTLGAEWQRSREIHYADSGNRQLFIQAEAITRELRRVYAIMSYRQNLFVRHFLSAGYHNNAVTDTILMLNPEYFVSGSHQEYLALAYEFIGDWRDLRSYPRDGEKVQVLLRKNGFGSLSDYNQGELRTRTELHRHPLTRLILSLVIESKTSLVEKQPYFNYRGLGFGNTLVRGYERYVVNGEHFVLAQGTAKFRFLSLVIKRPLIISVKSLDNMPMDLYLKPHVDAGYVWDPFFHALNPLTNRLLIGYGLGLDIVTYYDLVTSINFTVNGQGEAGVYLHFNL